MESGDFEANNRLDIDKPVETPPQVEPVSNNQRKAVVTLNDDWMAEGRCRELSPSVFFPGDGAGVEAARKICKECVVKVICLEYALVNRIDHGVWGGTSERERRRILRQRRISSKKQ